MKPVRHRELHIVKACSPEADSRATRAVATLILPQLWAMSIGPLLNADQFAKFMSVIKRLSTRVEDEHSKQLGELRRLEESSGMGNGVGRTNGTNGASSHGIGRDGEIDFESLVMGGGGPGGVKREVPQDVWADESPSAMDVSPRYGTLAFRGGRLTSRA